jgi:serine O-acetyltransferase
MIKELKEDLAAYKGNRWAPGYRVMRVYRLGQWRYGIRNPLLRKSFSLLYKVLYRKIILQTGIELPCEAKVGKNFRIDHQSGIVISGYAQFGDNCVVRNGVTVGLKNVKDPQAPIIGNNVDIGAGAKVLGAITIGDDVNIGANAVVLSDIPSHSIAVGIPATIKPKDKNHG